MSDIKDILVSHQPADMIKARTDQTFRVDDLDFWNAPSVERLSPYLTINGITKEPILRYIADNIGDLSWAGSDYGPVLDLAGTGSVTKDLATPGYGSKDLAVCGNGTRSYINDNHDLAVGVKDIVCEGVFYDGLNEKRNQQHIASWYSNNGIILLQRLSNNSLNVYLKNNASTINTSFVQSAVDVISATGWYHFIYFIDRSGFGKIYINGLASGADINISAYAAISADGDNKLALLSRGNISTFYTGYLAYFAMWTGADWLDTHEQDNLALERYTQYAGCQPQKSLGSGNPAVYTRASSAVQKRWNGTTHDELTVGTNWPVLDYVADSNSVAKYAYYSGRDDRTRDEDDLQYAALNNIRREFTFESEILVAASTGDDQYIAMIDDESANNKIEINLDASGYASVTATTSGTEQLAISGSTNLADDTWHKIKIVCYDDNAKLYVDDVLIGTDASCTMPSDLTRIMIGRASADGSELNGHIRNIRIY